MMYGLTKIHPGKASEMDILSCMSEIEKVLSLDTFLVLFLPFWHLDD